MHLMKMPLDPLLTLSLSHFTAWNTVTILNHGDEGHSLGMAKWQFGRNLTPCNSCSKLLQEKSKFPSGLNQSYLESVSRSGKPNPLNTY